MNRLEIKNKINEIENKYPHYHVDLHIKLQSRNKNRASRNPKLKKNGTSILKRMGAKLKELTNTK
jgi:hypothetical protein